MALFSNSKFFEYVNLLMGLLNTHNFAGEGIYKSGELFWEKSSLFYVIGNEISSFFSLKKSVTFMANFLITKYWANDNDVEVCVNAQRRNIFLEDPFKKSRGENQNVPLWFWD